MSKQTATPKTQIDFMRYRWFFVGVSLAVMAFSVFVWIESGPNKYGVDFLGGSEVVVRFNEPTTPDEIRAALVNSGINNAVVQKFETVIEEGPERFEYSVRVKATQDAKESDKIKLSFGNVKDRSFEILKNDYVGPIIGDQIRRDGIKATIAAIIGILIYVSFRFEWRFAVGAIAALVHDVVVTAGLFIFSGREISVGVLAALLTIIGYSINDTIVIFDRLRENLTEELRKGGKDARRKASEGLQELMNLTLNQTLSRTILTSLTVFFVVCALWLFGGGDVAEMAFALVIGTVAGVYSTIFIACALVLALKR